MFRKLALAAAISIAALGAAKAGNGVGAYTGASRAVTLGTTPVQVLFQNNNRSYLDLVNQSTTATISCSFGLTTPATNGAGSITLAAGTHREWNIFVPTDNVVCVASAASTPLTIGAYPN